MGTSRHGVGQGWGNYFLKLRGRGGDGDDENGDIYLSPCSSLE